MLNKVKVAVPFINHRADVPFFCVKAKKHLKKEQLILRFYLSKPRFYTLVFSRYFSRFIYFRD